MKKKILMLTALVAIAGTGLLFAMNTNNSVKGACNGACCQKSTCCTEGTCATECNCGDECTGEDCSCGCTCCE